MEPMEMLKDFYDRIKNNKNLTVSDYVIVGSMAMWLNSIPDVCPSDFDVALRPSKLAYFPAFPEYVDPLNKRFSKKDGNLEEREKEFNGWIYWSGTVVIPGLVGRVRTLTVSGCHAFYTHWLARPRISPATKHKFKTRLRVLEKRDPRLKMPRW